MNFSENWSTMYEQIEKAACFIRDRVGTFAPRIGIVLGSGLGGLVEEIEVVETLEYGDIPGFPVSTVQGHAGRLVFGVLGGKNVVAMQGRFHYYEGWTPAQVVFPVRVMARLGVEVLMVSNAAGGVRGDLRVGDLMVIEDHINLLPNPLVGLNDERLGPRFVDMHDCYDAALRALAHGVNGGLKSGVYVGGTGPTFETQAEYRFYAAIGGDAAGMSTTPEVIAARHMGLRVFGASVITNIGISSATSGHGEVLDAGVSVAPRMARLFEGIITNL